MAGEKELMQQQRLKFQMDLAPKERQRQQQQRQAGERKIEADTYDTDALTKENARIIRQLGDAVLWQGDAQEQRFAQREKEALKTRQTRNLAILLYVDRKDKTKAAEETDSPEMQNIKTALWELDILLRKPLDLVEHLDQDVDAAYGQVIQYCHTYENAKHSIFPTGRRRKKKVIAMREGLEAERERFLQAVAGLRQENGGQLPEGVGTSLALLEGGHIQIDLAEKGLAALAMEKRRLDGLKKVDGRPDEPEMERIKQEYGILVQKLRTLLLPEAG